MFSMFLMVTSRRRPAVLLSVLARRAASWASIVARFSSSSSLVRQLERELKRLGSSLVGLSARIFVEDRPTFKVIVLV
jgi:hypothetical protein